MPWRRPRWQFSVHVMMAGLCARLCLPGHREQGLATEGLATEKGALLQRTGPCYREQGLATENRALLQRRGPCHREQGLATEKRALLQEQGLATEKRALLQRTGPCYREEGLATEGLATGKRALLQGEWLVAPSRAARACLSRCLLRPHEWGNVSLLLASCAYPCAGLMRGMCLLASCASCTSCVSLLLVQAS